MKKLITLCVCAIMAITTIYAQDIIVTTDAQKIEAKILEVSKTEIKYKEKDNLDGPTFILETKDISSIIYSNGKVVLYNQPVATESKDEPKEEAKAETEEILSNAPIIDENTAEILTLSGQTLTAQVTELKSDHVGYILNGNAYTMPASQIEKVTFVQSGQVKEYKGYGQTERATTTSNQSLKYVSRNGNTYYYDGKSMRGKTYENFLQKNCTLAYNEYKNGHKVATAGWVLFGIGLGMDLGFSWWAPYTWIPALGFEIACIPTLAVGYSRMHHSADTFNGSCSKRTVSYWSINSSKNGIGIAWNF